MGESEDFGDHCYEGSEDLSLATVRELISEREQFPAEESEGEGTEKM